MVSVIKNIRKIFSSNGGGGGGSPLPYTPEDVANKATNFSTVNDTLYPSVKAVNDHIDARLVGLWDDRGSYDASSNLFPSTGGSGTAGAIMKGDIWTINVQGTLGGVVMHIGDTVRALVDSPGQTSTNWALLENAIGYVPENVANKVTTMTGNTTSNTLYLSAKAVYDWATGLFASLSGATFTGPISATNLSGTNTGDETQTSIKTKLGAASGTQDGYLTSANWTTFNGKQNAIGYTPANKAGETFTGAISATNLSGTNTGDQTYIAPRTQTVFSAATVTPTSNNDVVAITTQAVSLVLANPTGTFVQGQSLLIKIKDDGTARNITFDTNYRAVNTTLPTTTTISKVLYIGIVYNSNDLKWDVVGVALEGATPSTAIMDILQVQVFS